jgi:hypothetical protein
MAAPKSVAASAALSSSAKAGAAAAQSATSRGERRATAAASAAAPGSAAGARRGSAAGASGGGRWRDAAARGRLTVRGKTRRVSRAQGGNEARNDTRCCAARRARACVAAGRLCASRERLGEAQAAAVCAVRRAGATPRRWAPRRASRRCAAPPGAGAHAAQATAALHTKKRTEHPQSQPSAPASRKRSSCAAGRGLRALCDAV